LKASKTIEPALFKISALSGRDISREGDRSILRRVIRKGDAYDTPNEDASVEIRLKGIYQGQVFDERTVSFVAGAGIAENIPHGYVLNLLK
jgi:hypothetical protein